jgi:hypothetical protein
MEVLKEYQLKITVETLETVLKTNNMSRTSKSRGVKNFSMRSGNKPSTSTLAGIMKSPLPKEKEGFTYGDERLVSETTDELTGATTRVFEKEGTKSTPGSGGGSPEFNQAFAEARRAGKNTFTFDGEEFTTKKGGTERDVQSRTQVTRQPVPTLPVEPLQVPTDRPEIRQTKRMRRRAGLEGDPSRVKRKLKVPTIKFPTISLGRKCRPGSFCPPGGALFKPFNKAAVATPTFGGRRRR